MGYFKLSDVLSALEQAFEVSEERRKAFRERISFVFRTTTILNNNNEQPGRDRHDFHSFHRVATTLGLMMTGLRAERCHHVIAPHWKSYFALPWAEAWQAAATSTNYRPYLVVGSDGGPEYTTGANRMTVVRMITWAKADEPISVPPGLPISEGASGYRILDLGTMAKRFRADAATSNPSMVAAFDDEALRVVQTSDYWLGLLATAKNEKMTDEDSPVALSPEIEVDIAFEPALPITTALGYIKRRAENRPV